MNNEIKKNITEYEKLLTFYKFTNESTHEIKNILAIIKSSIEFILLNEKMGKIVVPKDLIEELDVINFQNDRCNKIINSILTLSKPKKDKESVYLRDIINDIILLQKKKLEEENIEVTTKLSEIPKINVIVSDFIYMFLILFMNARSKIVSIGSGKIFISTALKDRNIEINFKCTTITDEGIQKKDSIKNKIGMNYIKKIIHDYDGVINYSENRNNSECIISLPLNENDHLSNDSLKNNEENNEIDIEPLKKNNDLSILIVDDEINLINSLTRLLKTLGYKNVAGTDSGHEAIDIIKNNEIDIVILDCNLPLISGDKIYHEIKKIKKGMNIIFMSGENNKEVNSILELEDSRNTFFINKPFKINELSSIIKKV